MSGASDLTPESVAATIAEAEKNGFMVMHGDDTTLLLDLDTKAASEQCARVLPTVLQYFNVIDTQEWKSKSGNRHVKLTLGTPQPAYVRYALQAALGSDGVKEVLTLLREKSGCEEFSSLLFKPRRKLVNRKPQ